MATGFHQIPLANDCIHKTGFVTPEGHFEYLKMPYGKVTQGAEPRYHSYELETLAVVKALQHFRHYLIGIHFKVVTDCNALKLTQRKKDLLPRVARWWIYLQDYDFSLEYRKGAVLSHADYLSRNPINPIESWKKPDVHFDTVHSDVLGPLPESNGYRFVVLIIDAYSKFCLLNPMRKQDATELKLVFESAVSLFGAPRQIVTDRGRMYENRSFRQWVSDVGSNLFFITPEMHQSNGQAERYCRTVLNMIRVEVNFRNENWSEVLWKLQLTLNVTKQKSTQYSPLYLLIGSDAVTPVIRSVVRDVALEGTSANRETLRELARQRASQLLDKNRKQQDTRVNERRKPPRTFHENDVVFVHKNSQSVGKLDSGMRGPDKIVRALPHGRYELKLLSGSLGKTTEAAAEFISAWHGEWTPDVCTAFFEYEHNL
ncbi:uncharacterized protein LOC134201633 [Bombyx mori]|uniref:uncharacterized protein LOC134201633 n=1 Tax=Bombyx mori TaxID=7091 RepID=UPI002ED33935